MFVGKGNRPVEVMCQTDTLVHPIDAEDNAIALVKYESGAIGQFEVSWTFRGGMDLRERLYRGVPALEALRQGGHALVDLEVREAGFVEGVELFPVRRLGRAQDDQLLNLAPQLGRQRPSPEAGDPGALVNQGLSFTAFTVTVMTAGSELECPSEAQYSKVSTPKK